MVRTVNTKAFSLLILAILFAILYFILAFHSFAQSPRRLAALNANALRVCQVHEKTIINRLNSLTRLVTNQENKFASIAVRVENHYTTKLVPQGKTLSNYNALVEDIASKKMVVDADLAKAKSDASSFSCSASNPKSLLTTFRLDMQTVKQDLKAYRKSIRNLIVAILGLKGQSPSPTAKP